MTMIVSNSQPIELEFEQVQQPPTQAQLDLAQTNHSPELNRLLVAAVVNRRFCRLLLVNPTAALAVGYRGQPFKLTAAEQRQVLAICATSLVDFARQLRMAAPLESVSLRLRQWSSVHESPR